MRVYVTDSQIQIIAEWLHEKDVACHIFHDPLKMDAAASSHDSWGCVLCPIYGPKDSGWLLEAWNRDGGHLVEAAILKSSTVECLLACPDWATQDPFVRTIIRKLAGTKFPPSSVDWEKCDGLVPAIAQDAATGDVLMQAFMDEIAFAETLATGRAVYFSRSRRKLWRKGEESGNVQIVKEIRVDCDADSVILKVDQVGGAACHTGYASCFFQRIEADGSVTIVGDRVFDPTQVYHK